MNQKQILVKGIYSLLDEVGDSLPSANTQDARELLEYDEWGEAFDLICTQLYEYDVEISMYIYKKIECLGGQMEMDSKIWTDLKDLVKP